MSAASKDPDSLARDILRRVNLSSLNDDDIDAIVANASGSDSNRTPSVRTASGSLGSSGSKADSGSVSTLSLPANVLAELETPVKGRGTPSILKTPTIPDSDFAMLHNPETQR